MNIFLIFISMFIMIGYYILSSPSQNLVGQEAEYVIQQSDIRSIIECVVSKQNAVMYCQPFTDECVARYNVTSKYVDVDSSGAVIGSDSMEELCGQTRRVSQIPSVRYIITTSYALSQEERDNVWDVLETFYSDRGTLGIVNGTHLIVPNSAEHREIPENIISTANLVDNQLADIMPYRIPNIDVPEEGDDDDEERVCPPGTVLVVQFGHEYCRSLTGVDWCQEGTVYNAETEECEPDETFVCPEEGAPLVQIDGVWTCQSSQETADCPNGILIFNTSSMSWECKEVEDPETFKENCAEKNPGYVFSSTDLVGPTLHVKTISCSPCEKIAIDSDTCEVYCTPNINKLGTRTCFSGDPSSCRGDEHMGIYYGFTRESRLDALTDEAGNHVTLPFTIEQLLDSNHAQNRKFNCMRCKYSVIKPVSVDPYVAICSDEGDGETVDVSKNPPEVIDDNDDWPSIASEPEPERSVTPNNPQPDPFSSDQQEEGSENLDENQTGTENLDEEKTETKKPNEEQTGTGNLNEEQTGTGNTNEEQTGTENLDEEKKDTENLDEEQTGTESLDDSDEVYFPPVVLTPTN